ncbi:hypothetical protein ACFL21_01470 [Patescibacteria group bacterium]
MNCKKENCNAHAMKESAFCFMHNPETKEKHLEATSKGGAVTNDAGSVPLKPMSLKTPKDAVVLLEDTINRVRKTHEDGTMDLKVANCIGYLVGQLIKSIEISDIASQLEVIERVILERKSLIKK